MIKTFRFPEMGKVGALVLGWPMFAGATEMRLEAGRKIARKCQRLLLKKSKPWGVIDRRISEEMVVLVAKKEDDMCQSERVIRAIRFAPGNFSQRR